MTGISKEFPDFDLSTLPAIPEGWQDTSWHNDMSPSWATMRGMSVFIDYADPADRESGKQEPK